MKTPYTLLTAITLVLSGCIDNRLRELGDTLTEPSGPSGDGVSLDDPTCEYAAFLDADGVARAIFADVSSSPSADRPYLRYVSLADRADFGVCQEELTRGREAFAKLINALSQQPDIVAPRAVDDNGILLRIDLRDYGWTHPVDVDGVTYSDGWEAVIATNAFAIELEGEQASAIASATQTRVPYMNASAFVAAASTELYYALLGVPETLGELRASVGLPAELDPLANGAVRAATSRSRILRSAGNVRAVDRYAIDNGTAGSYWEALQIDTAAYLADPLHVQPDAQRLITFTLPNDLFAFAIMGADGQRRSTGELVLDTNRDDFTATISSSCQNCHAQGLIPLEDDAGQAILDNPDQFPPDVVAALADGPDEVERAQQVQDDSALYAAALARAGVRTDGGDPISNQYFRFALDVDLPAAAADLLVTPEALLDRLPELDPTLSPLGVGLELSRERFGELYASAYCGLHADDENPPTAAACE
jgi:hypothetical protein